MKGYQKKLLTRIASEYDVTLKSLEDLISSSKKFTYENTTVGHRQSEYQGIIKHAINNSKQE